MKTKKSFGFELNESYTYWFIKCIKNNPLFDYVEISENEAELKKKSGELMLKISFETGTFGDPYVIMDKPNGESYNIMFDEEKPEPDVFYNGPLENMDLELFSEVTYKEKTLQICNDPDDGCSDYKSIKDFRWVYKDEEIVPEEHRERLNKFFNNEI